MKRIFRATFVVPGSAVSAPVTAAVTQDELDAAVPSSGLVHPFGLIFDPEDVDVTVESLVLKNAQNSENQVNLIPSGSSGLSLAAINKITTPHIGRWADLSAEVVPSGIEAPTYPESFGLAFDGVFSNADTNPKNITVVIVVES